MSIPPPPPGFSLDGAPRKRRNDDEDVPPPPPGFEMDAPAPASPPITRPVATAPRLPAPPSLGSDSIVRPIDGDTAALQSGRHLRLYGVDAPELKQQGWDRQGRPVAIGQQSRDGLGSALARARAAIGAPVGMSYGRPVAPVDVGGEDLGLNLTRQGSTLAAPDFLKDDPQRRFQYLQAERLARLNGLGVHDTMFQVPAEFRKAPMPAPSRETVAQFWDTPTPLAGMRPDTEQQFIRMANDPKVPIADVVAFAHDNGGFTVDPANVEKSRAAALKLGLTAGVEYAPRIKPLTDLGDGTPGALVRGGAQGVAMNQLEELGAVPDTLGLTPGRESIWNSDRRLADIYANNLLQNEAITGYDRFAHPWASTGAEVVGGLAVPMGRVRNAADLAKFGALYGGVAGLGQEGTIPERLTSGVIGAGMGLGLTVGGTKALEAVAPYASRLIPQRFRNVPEPPPGFRMDDVTADAVPSRAPDRIDIGPARQMPAEPSGVPLETGNPGPAPAAGGLRNRDWIDISEVPPPPEGFTLDRQGSMGMGAQGMPSLSAPERQPDYLDMGNPRAQRIDEPLSDASRHALARDLLPSDLLPIPSNMVDSAEEAARIEAGRYAEARVPNERTELGKRTVRAWNGAEVPKVGPIDMVGWLRTHGGLLDQGGELSHMGLTNAARKMDFAGSEQRFGPLVNNDSGMNLDDAAMRAWEAGYFPDHSERPSVNEFLDALRDTHEGRNRRFLPEDYPEIDRFYGTQADRYALQQQRLETGQPVYADRSVPAEEAPPLPPVQAYEEWPAGGPDFAGNINLTKLESPQDISRALDVTNRRVGFDAATRGRVSHAETERLASDLGLTPDALLARRKGQAFNAEEALAARQILAKSGNELVNLAKRVRSMDEPGDDVLAAFREAWLRHTAIQEQVSGMTAEAGRALSQFRMLAKSNAVPRQVLGAFINSGGGPKRLQDAAEVIIDAVGDGPGVFNPLVEKLSKPRWIDKAIELRYNYLLSGPQTHAANMISNTLTALTQIPEHMAASAIGKVRQLAPGANADRVVGTEVGWRAFGMLQGVKEGLAQFGRTLRTGETSDLVTKVESQAQEAIGGALGKFVRTPSRLLSAEDEFFKAVARRMELNGLAARKASMEGLKGKAAADRIAELTSNPPDDLLAQSFDYARYLTFQRPLTGIPQTISAATNRHPSLKFFVPFVRTPTNLLKYAAEHSPAAPLVREWRADVLAGGARRDLALAKATVGTGVALWVADLAKQGVITGSAPSDQNKARLLRADGWQPNSIRMGDQYVSYNRLDPYAVLFATAADLATKQDGMTDRQLEDASGLLVASVIKSMGDRTWLSGLSDLFAMTSDPQRNLAGYTQNQAASLVVPAGVAQIARAIDPTRRETGTVGEEIRARVPGLSSSLPPKRDVWGQPIATDRLGPDVVSPITQTQRRNDPVNREMLRLGAVASEFPKSRMVDGKSVRYTPQEYDQVSAQAGQQAKSALTSLVAGPGWKQLSPDQQVKAIKSVIANARRDARANLGAAPRSGPTSGLIGSSIRNAPKLSQVPPPPPGFSEDGAAGGVNVYADLQRVIPGIRITSGFRTPEYQAEMRRRGYHPAQNSAHLDGSALDLLPPPGKPMSWLKDRVRAYDPNARLLNEGDHLHVTFPGYYGAPALGGARAAKLRNPNAGLPPPPPGFKLD